jgi:prepilin-type N-terminal cleavage/methylation domain-containing protein
MVKRGRHDRAMTLIEVLVVLVIIAAVAGAVTFAVANSLRNQEAKECQTSMLMIESAKDEYARDHPGDTQIDLTEFRKYFPKYGLPGCPLHQVYQNLDQLNTKVSCPLHGEVRTN